MNGEMYSDYSLHSPFSQLLGDSNFPTYGLRLFQDERIRLVQYLFSFYSSLQRSNTRDRFLAISGLQDRIGRTFESPVSHGVLWRWPERMLLWRAAETGGLELQDYSGRPPSWSWMAYEGQITFMEIPFYGVEWKGHIHPPPDEDQDSRLAVFASGLHLHGGELVDAAVLDTKRAESDTSSWMCVVLGEKKTGAEGEDASCYVLLIRRIIYGPLDQYERVGVATLLKRHISSESSHVPVWVC